MSKLSIKVNIGGRSYPLTIDAHEEEFVRRAAQKLNEAMQFFQETYAVKDKQDLLAMAALQNLTQSMMESDSSQVEGEKEALKQLNNTLQAFEEAHSL